MVIVSRRVASGEWPVCVGVGRRARRVLSVRVWQTAVEEHQRKHSRQSSLLYTHTMSKTKSFQNPIHHLELNNLEQGSTPFLEFSETEEPEEKTEINYKLIGGFSILLFVGAVVVFLTFYQLPTTNGKADAKQVAVKDIADLSSAEKEAVLKGLISMKTCTSQYDKTYNAYDYFVKIHNDATVPKTEIHGTGFLFFPWHREMQNRFHTELQRCSGNPGLFVPYYDQQSPRSKQAVMSADYLGANGNPQNGYIVEEGLLGSKKGLWKINKDLRLPPSGDYLRRAIGHGIQMCLEIGVSCTEAEANAGSAKCDNYLLDSPDNPENVDKKTTVGPFLKIPRYADPKPTPAFGFTPDAENSQCSWTDLSCVRKYYQENGNLVLKCKHFAPVPQPYADCNKLTKFLPADGKKVFFNSPDNPYPDNPYMVAPSYTNAKPDEYWAACIEGNNPSDMYAAGLERIGASLSTHGSVHTAIGGSLATPYSPNDPMFAHLHGNVDRMWALYQEQHGTGAWFENVAKDRLDTPMPLFKNPTVTIRDVLDMNKMPFKYQQSLPQVVVKDIAVLSSAEKEAVLKGLISMKTCKSQYDETYNAYDYFVKIHNDATVPKTEIHGTGFLFFPWHREMQNRFHTELQRCSGNPGLFVPYYDQQSPRSKQAVMSADYLGANGNPQNGYIVEEGLLGSKKGLWKINKDLRLPPSGDYLRRAIGHGIQMCLEIGVSCTEAEANAGSAKCDNYLLDSPDNPENVDKKTTVGPFLKIPRYADPKPTPAFGFTPDAENSQCSWTDLSCVRKYYQENGNLVLKCKHFAPVPQPYADCNKLTKFLPADGKKVFFNSPDNPYPDNPYMVAPSYTNAKPDEYWAACIEGNNPSDMYAAGLERIGASLSTHGSVHTAIGGSLATPYSPNDPMFAHLHGNVDRMWALYQEQHGTGAWFENVAKDRLDTPMPIFKNPTVTIRDVLDMNKMPFKYA